MPDAVNTDFLRCLSRLHIHCVNNHSFHQANALFSSVFCQLNHLSLKLRALTFISGPLCISGDTIQQLCIDRLNPCATYALDLFFYVVNDLDKKIIFNRFFNVPFVYQQQPRVYIQERANWEMKNYHCFMVYTLPYNEKRLQTDLFSTNMKRYIENS